MQGDNAKPTDLEPPREKFTESRKVANLSSVNVSQAAAKHGLNPNITVFSTILSSS